MRAKTPSQISCDVRKANLLFLLLFQARHTERLDGPPSRNPTISSRGGCGGGGRGRKGAFRHPPSCFFVRSSPLPLLSLTKIPVVFPFPSERSIAQAEEDDAPATKGGRASRRTVDDGGGWGTGSARYRGGRGDGCRARCRLCAGLDGTVRAICLCGARRDLRRRPGRDDGEGAAERRGASRGRKEVAREFCLVATRLLLSLSRSSSIVTFPSFQPGSQ